MNASIGMGIDLGGTRIKGVLVDRHGEILHRSYVHTHDDSGGWQEAVKSSFEDMREKTGGRTFALGLSAPGIPDERNTRIRFMPGRLEGLEGLDWSTMLGHPCSVMNDAIAAMAAEARFGKARGMRHVAMLTLGTGVGGALLLDGWIYQGAFQKAGHLGHITVDHAGEPDVTGMPGSLEDAIGNCTIEQRSKGRFKSTHDLLEAYRLGDASARDIWLLSVRKLAIGIASITNVVSPELIVLGGGITEAGEDLFGPLGEYMAEYEWRAGGQGVRIEKAAFGDLAGAIGAAGFAMMEDEDKH